MNKPEGDRKKSSAWLAECVQGRLVGPGDVWVTGVASLQEARPQDVSFLGNPKYRDRVLPSAAGVVLVPEGFDPPPPEGRAWVVCENPSEAFSAVVATFAPAPVTFPPGCHETAVVARDAQIPDSVHVGAHAVVCSGAVLGENTVIAAGSYIGEKTTIGADCLIYPNVTIRERCMLGDRVIVHPGVVIGADGFGYNPVPGGHEKIPQVGIVQIDDDVEIGAQTCIDRARFGRTWIQQGTKIDNLVQIAHNVVIGRHCIIIGQAGISGSTQIGHGAILAGQAAVAGHLTLGDGAVAMAKAGVTKDVGPGQAVVGIPAVGRREFARQQMNIKRIDRLNKAVKELEKRVEELTAKLQK